MSITTISARDFARDLAHAKRAAQTGPVFVTDRGRPRYALLRIEDYHQLAGQPAQTLLDLMQSIPGGEGLEFEPERVGGDELVRAADVG